MKIFLLRHAQAVDAGGRPDEHRFLSAEGRRTSGGVGQRLREEGVEFEALLSSPLVRAVQTAEIVAQQIGFTAAIEACPALIPGSPVSHAAEVLERRGSVAAVGHEPQISALAALLTGRPACAAFRPGEIALIEDGRPRWIVDPETFQIRPWSGESK